MAAGARHRAGLSPNTPQTPPEWHALPRPQCVTQCVRHARSALPAAVASVRACWAAKLAAHLLPAPHLWSLACLCQPKAHSVRAQSSVAPQRAGSALQRVLHDQLQPRLLDALHMQCLDSNALRVLHRHSASCTHSQRSAHGGVDSVPTLRGRGAHSQHPCTRVHPDGAVIMGGPC
jgi:hypothetical protein